jgi:hypothetical protein
MYYFKYQVIKSSYPSAVWQTYQIIPPILAFPERKTTCEHQGGVQSDCDTGRVDFVTVLFSLFALLRNCNNFALSIVAATLTPLGQGNLTHAKLPRNPDMSHCPLLKAARPEQPPDTAPICLKCTTIILDRGCR